MNIDITHDEGAHRFTISVDEQMVGYAQYERRDDSWLFTDTYIKPEFNGRGLAGKLVGHALDEVIATGGTIVPVCPYVVGFVEKNPQYQAHL